MKKIIVLIGFFFCVTGIYAQKIETHPLDAKGDSYEVRIKHFDKMFGKMFVPENMAPLLQEKTKADLRAKWRERCAKKMSIESLKRILKQVGETEGGGLWVTFYIDKTGKVLTVKFMVTSSVYVKLPAKIWKELYNMAMEEKLDPSGYNFDGEHVYAVDGFDLMKRAVGEGER